MKSGIYCIFNEKTNKYYIGSSHDIEERKINHFSMLRNNKHHSIYLQRAWNKSKNKENFIFKILEYCNEEELMNKENYYLNILCKSNDYIEKKNRDFLKLSYNILPFAQKGFCQKHRKETIEKLKLCNPNRINILIYDCMGNYIETLPSAKTVENKYNIAKTSILNLCHKNTYISKKTGLLFGFENDNNFKNFIEKTPKPILFKVYCKGLKLPKEKIGNRGNPMKIKVTFIENKESKFYNSQKECSDSIKLQPCTINRCLKSKKPYKKKILFEYCEDIV